MKNWKTVLLLGLAVMNLSACTTTAESQLKESVCKDCLGKKRVLPQWRVARGGKSWLKQ